MEKSKKKVWAKEILIFWLSLAIMLVTYLVSFGVVEAIIYFKNKEVHSYNAQLEKSRMRKRAELDSLKQTQFAQNPVETEENQEKREKLIDFMLLNGYEAKTYLKFKKKYCCDIEEQRKLHRFLEHDGADVGEFNEFQKVIFGDYLNPDWTENQKKIEQLGSELSALDMIQNDYKNEVYFKYFGLAWFLVVYPLRGIVFSILWAVRTVKEK